MKFAKIILITAILLNGIVGFLSAGNPKEINVVVIMDNMRNKHAKYYHNDLKKGLSSQKLKAQITFKTYKEADAQLFNQYDIVVAMSDKEKDRINPGILPFVKQNAKNQKLILLSFLPGGRSKLTTPPPGIDAMTSSSQKKSAQALVMGAVSKEIARRFLAE